MSSSEVIGKLAGTAASAADAIKSFAAKVEEAEMKVYQENSDWRGARNLHAAVRAPLLACQGQRIHAINSISEALRCKATRGLYSMLDRRLKDERPSRPGDLKGVKTLVHRTSPDAGRSILESRKMRPGREGTLGAGIYFAEDAEACAKKAQIYGGKGEYALVFAEVDLGMCRVVELGELGWRMVRDCGFKKEDLDRLGFSSVGTNFHGGWEYCVFDPDRVTVKDVTFHNPREESGSSEEEARLEIRAGPAEGEAPVTLIRASPECEWISWPANPKVVVVIAPGAGMKKHAYLYKDLERQGYEVVPIFDDSYDHYPPGTEVLGSLGIQGLHMPDLRFNRKKNLATFVEEVVHPRIIELVSEGRGPAVVIAASRGGIVSMPKLWECGWQGPSVVGNGGFVNTSAIPAFVRCVLITAGWDCFSTRNPETTAALLKKEDPENPVLLYHDPQEDHDLNRLQGSVLGRLVQLAAASGPFDASAAGPWPEGTELRVL